MAWDMVLRKVSYNDFDRAFKKVFSSGEKKQLTIKNQKNFFNSARYFFKKHGF